MVEKNQSWHLKLYEIQIPLSINKVLLEYNHTMLMAESSSCDRDYLSLQSQKYLLFSS